MDGNELAALRAKQNALVGELALATDPKRLAELIAELEAAGVTVNATPKDVTPAEPFVPKGCVLGNDVIIRTAPGVFEATYQLEVERRARSDRSYRREAQALKRLARQKASRAPRMHLRARRLDEHRPRSRRPGVRRAHAPPRESDDDPDPSRPGGRR